MLGEHGGVRRGVGGESGRAGRCGGQVWSEFLHSEIFSDNFSKWMSSALMMS